MTRPEMPTTARDYYAGSLTWESDIRGHLPLLRALARGNVIELGVRGGVSTGALLAAVEAGDAEHLTSIDINDCSEIWAYGHPGWTFIQGDSRQGALAAKLDRGDGFGLVFIDTDHTYETTRAELWAWGMTRARCLALHDAELDGVCRAATEFAEAVGAKIMIYPGYHGLAVVEKVPTP